LIFGEGECEWQWPKGAARGGEKIEEESSFVDLWDRKLQYLRLKSPRRKKDGGQRDRAVQDLHEQS
jgi:hypothetical protein